jgi:hypothetical protein
MGLLPRTYKPPIQPPLVSKFRGVFKRRTKISRLPEDVIDVILACLYPYISYDCLEFNPDDTSRNDVQCKALIARLCLVSRSWLNPAQRVLYRTITEDYINLTEGLIFWRTIENSPHLRSLVRQVYFCGRQPAWSFSAEFCTLLPYCTILIFAPNYWPSQRNLLAESDISGHLLAGPTTRYSPDIWMSGF